MDAACSATNAANDSYRLFFFNDTATTEIYTLSLHDAFPISVGLGWMLEDVHGEPGWTWTGDVGTSSSEFLVLPERHLGVAVIANADAPASLNQLAQALVAIALGGEPAVAPTAVDVAHLPTAEPDRTAWDSYVG